eukprot:CAMPEP_0181521582 /NCGR_PEP_ID=MMETSP1110-20121109/66913_1 /TAXON_ID=174948 /ORGANISM="Symbiodinium sp., Strain CCMP421" /LENGTH=49 /DNA_ID= /DNA_START= /DNA_END= /DNA_ORIENTATION=
MTANPGQKILLAGYSSGASITNKSASITRAAGLPAHPTSKEMRCSRSVL